MIQNTKFRYATLKELINVGDYNFYAIIYDATLPAQDKNPNQYVCSIKVIDKEINRLNNPNSLQNEIVTIIIKSNSKDNLPYIHRFGDIIRIQRGNFMSNKKIVYLNLTSQNIKSTWTIFPSK
jgi:hypothetical protein